MKSVSFADLNDVVLLMHVANHGGYSAAARALRIPKSTISERMAALERSLGTGLFRRTSRSFSLTEAGKLLLPHARAIDQNAKEAQQRIEGLANSSSGLLRIATSNALAEFAIGPLLPAFLREHPNVTLELDVRNTYIDPIGEGFDVCVRAHGARMKNSSLRQRVVARTPWSLAAAPTWCEGKLQIAAPEDLASRDILSFGVHSDQAALVLAKGSVSKAITVRPRLICASMATLLGLAVAGAGVVALPSYILGPALRAGQLVRVLTDWQLPSSTVSVLMPERRQLSVLAGLFSDFLAKELNPSLERKVP